MMDFKPVRQALASLSRAKGYCATIVCTLGITLGAVVTMFSLNYQLLAAPLPYPDADRLYTIKGNLYRDGERTLEKSSQYPALIEIYNNSRHFSDTALAYFWEDVIRNLPHSPRVTVTYVTPEYLRLAQAPLVHGRHFRAEEGLNTRVPVALLSYQTWTQQFNQDPDILQRTLRFGDVDFRIVGVLAQGFIEPAVYAPGRRTQVWLPWDYNNTAAQNRNNWRGFSPFMFAVGKLDTQARPETVQHQLSTSLNNRYQEARVDRLPGNDLTTTHTLSTYERQILGNSTQRTLLLLAGTLILLLIAAANITNLILARAANRQRTMAIQAAMGAQRKHIFADLLTEICLLMLAAALLSILFTGVGVELLKHFARDQVPRLQELTINWQTCLFSAAMALLLALLFASLVSRQIDYRHLNQLLQSSGKGTGVQVSARTRQMLIASQIALTAILIVASLQLFLQSSRHINQPLGFSTGNIQVITLNIGNLRNAPAAQRENYLKSIREKLLSHPRLDNASLGLNTPIGFNRPLWHTAVASDASRQSSITAKTAVIDENYLPILELALREGRHMTAEEFSDGSRVLLINKTLAHQLQADQPEGNIVGTQLYWRGAEPYRVIGVVEDIHLPGQNEGPRLFVRHIDVDYPLFMLKYKPGQRLTSTELNNLFAEINGQYKVSEIFTLREARDFLLTKDRLAAWLTSGLTLLALGLAAIGIYGVLSYSVRLRRFELGIRMAIGAAPSTIFTQMLRENLHPVSLGLATAMVALAGLWFWVSQSSYALQTSLAGWLLPAILIALLVAVVSLLSVWRIIRRPAIFALRDH
ncbi:ABC transporter permease [Microbulbifer sp.]|uniref:ABC transporter permease n=1 Tax=Microbulbifer sp. TaxID=1908541 RepID=UPI0025884F5F|nr:ABC transporter permease [Microbulbifer sp.]